ncbi:hypothetical protein VNO78_23729 [Psophocarpus tetragonolobus]|uniref:Protein kinase domain-containing protein n=1 Tax=Psophocarpus tetragonolobus TaxID=3891 RepID=A0AAN9XE51_PSOTE
MSEQDIHSCGLLLFFLLILLSGKVVVGESLDTDKEVLLKLKSYLDKKILADTGRYIYWNTSSSNPCEWKGIRCSDTRRVVGIDLSYSDITGDIFKNFSQLTELTHLDLSKNTLSGQIPEDLRLCHKLVHLNLSHNILDGVLNLTGLTSLHTLDLSNNRFYGNIEMNFPAICGNLVTLNVSGNNNFTGRIENCFDQCLKLQYLDLSTNSLSGSMWMKFARLKKFSIAENHLTGTIPLEAFPLNCSLEELDLSQNGFVGEAPKGVANCKNLTSLNLSSNKFTGGIPVEIGSISGLRALYLGNNSFSREIPEALLNLTNLAFLDLSRNQFGEDIQEIFGKFKQLSFLLLHSNNYTGGLRSSGVFSLPNIWRLDLSYNNFSGPLPIEISKMSSLKFLMLSYNQFNGSIPPEFGNMTQLQALDLAFNNLSGPIPQSIGNLSSLLWLMLANNSLTGEIPRELGNCSSLLWLNLANNKLSGKLPSELSKIGRNATTTFESNRRNYRMIAGSGECLAMRRWIPADYPPFSFVYSLLTRKNCRELWDKLLKGYGVFPFCTPGSVVKSLQISGYVQLSSNQLSGEIPSELGTMVNFSVMHLGFNNFSGKLPPEMGSIPIVVLNITRNQFSGEIPQEIGNMKCLMNLDLSYNNFSGIFPTSLSKLTELNKFNISYNPFISGEVPSNGQFATFEANSYLGNPLLILPKFFGNVTNERNTTSTKEHKKSTGLSVFLVFLVITLVFAVVGLLTILVCVSMKNPSEEPRYLLRDTKHWHDSSSSGSSSWMSDTVKVIRLNKTAFTHSDILKATSSFSEDRIIGKGGFGIVYKGEFSDGRQVAVKKLQSEGLEGEKEFKAEMEVLSGHGFGWPHPNLVTLYGWCLNGSEKILIYEYIEGGSLEDLVTDRTRLTWRRRLEVAIDVARALVYLHHECYPAVVHRDVKASNVLLDKDGKAKVTDFGLARVVDVGDSHVSTMVAGTVGYVAPEYGHTWQATTKGDVYSFGVLVMELATARRAVDGGEECLVEWARRVMGYGRHHGHGLRRSVPVLLMGSGLVGGAEEMGELLRIGVMCSADAPQARPNMKEVLAMLIRISNLKGDSGYGHLV